MNARGFAPHEIVHQVHYRVLTQYVEDTPGHWLRRERAVRSPAYRLKDIERFDERLDAYLAGLMADAAEAWLCVRECIDAQDPASGFVSAVLAFSSGDVAAMRMVAATAGTAQPFAKAVTAALIWLPFEQVRPVLSQLWHSEAPQFRCMALGAVAGHGVDPVSHLAQALAQPDVDLLARAARVAGELARTDVQPQLEALISHPDSAVSFWAAWSLALRWDTPEALERLRVEIEAAGQLAPAALDVLIARLPPDEARAWLRSSGTMAPLLKVRAVGLLGDPVAVPWLIGQMSGPMAPHAGAAVSMITGLDLRHANFDMPPPEDPTYAELADDEKGRDLIEPGANDLAWPLAQELADWWEKCKDRFISGARYRHGLPIDTASLSEVLRIACQPIRHAAAIELAVHTGASLFDVTTRATRQMQALAEIERDLKGH